MRRTISQEEIEWAAKMRREGQSYPRIAEALHISVNTLWYDLSHSDLDYKMKPLTSPFVLNRRE